jgi:hypothetical protein
MILYNYNGEVTNSSDNAVAKVHKNPVFLIKRTSLGFFYNENKTYHRIALKENDNHPYKFTKVSPEVFNLYLKFLRTKNDLFIRKAERLYNENV